MTAFYFPTKESWYTKIVFRIFFMLKIIGFFPKSKNLASIFESTFCSCFKQKSCVLIRHDFVFCALFLCREEGLKCKNKKFGFQETRTPRLFYKKGLI